MMKRPGILFGALAALLAIVPTTSSSAGRPQAVKVLRASEQAIQIEFIPQYHSPRAVQSNDKEFAEYDFDGSASMASMREIGVPDLKYKLLPLGFQSKDGNVVQVVAAEYEEIPHVLLRPTPTLRVKDGMVEVKEYAMKGEAYGQNRFLPGNVAELSPVGHVRGLLVGGIKVFPLQYNPVTKILRKYSRIVVEVVYQSSSVPSIQTNDAALFDGALLNFEQAKNWTFGSPPSLNRLDGAPSVLNTGTWYRLSVTDEGMYILDANWFSTNGINLSSVNPQTIEIYGNGGEELAENISLPRPIDLVENAIHVEGEADGRWDPGDYVLFYGRGVQGVKYDPLAKTMRHYIHHYGRVNYYWLRVGIRNGKRMAAQQSVSEAATVVPTKFLDAVFVEPDTFNLLKSGKQWFSLPVGPGGVLSRALSLHGHSAGDQRLYRYTLVASSFETPTFTVRENGQVIATNSLGIIFPDDVRVADSGLFEVVSDAAVSSNTSQVSFSFSARSSGAFGYLDWLDVVYKRTFDPVNGNYLRFRSPDTNGVVQYQLGQFTGAATVFNVTEYSNVKRIVSAGVSFRATEAGGRVSEYLAVSSSGYKTPVAVTTIPNQNLRGVTQQVDFIIITSQEYLNAANKLKAHRETPAHGNLRTLVVDVNQIYNEFSCGVPDITAMRDYLRYTYQNYGTPTTRPRFVLFLGQASYDYKGINGRSSFVPTWETEESFDDIRSSATDDYFVRFGDGVQPDRPQMVTGRLNARSARQADFLVDRVIGYDTQSGRDRWKMRALYVADDSNPDGFEHVRGAETLATFYTPDIMEKRKIYTEEFPTVQTTQGRKKPLAYQAIIDEVNRGVLLVNFTGHGNPTVWTHEGIFSVPTSIPQLTNANRLAFFFAATCNFSQFDDPTRETGSEQLLNRVGGGAIGVVSASRKVYSAQNQNLNNGIYRNMFLTDRFGRINVDRVATALFRFKSLEHDDDNDEKYFVLGDPTMQLQFPRGYVAIDRINDAPVDTVDGVARTTPIPLKSLARIIVKGTVRDEANAIDSTASGRITLTVSDATRTIIIPGGFLYSAVGSTIYKGENSVSRGRFTASFIVPKDIAYADSTTRGRVVTYFSNSSAEGAGYTSKIWVGGSDSTARSDSAGPSIKIYLGNTYESSLGFRPGDVVNEKPTLYVDLVDSNGINTSISGVGHRIEAWIGDNAQSRDLTDYYTGKLDNFQAGTVTYPLSDLPQGRNAIRVRAWDTHNNARTAEAFFEVMSGDQLRVIDVMNYPNPFSKGTAFTFKHNQAVPVAATVKVYTLAGRLIQTLEHPLANDSFVSIPWDGRDKDGDGIANGVYLYKLLVRTVDGRFTSEMLGKLAVAK